jgi:hypothetical protein
MSKPRTIVMTFGRFNPPTAGHHLLAGTVMDTARQLGAEHRIYGSVTQDPKKNPLTPKQKSRHMRRVLGTRNVVVDPTIVSPFHALKHVSDQGYENVIMITGSDREAIFDKVPEYQKRGDFKFKTFKVMTAGGKRGDKAEGLAGMSATKQRGHASAGNFEAFRLGLPAHVSEKHARSMFRDVRRGMGLNEETNFIPSHTFDEIMEFANSTEELNEIFSIQARMKLARSARRTAKRRAFLVRLRKKRRRNMKQLKKRATVQVKTTLRKRLYKGNWKKLSYGQRMRIDSAINKRKPIINRMVKSILPKVVTGEAKRLTKLNRSSSIREDIQPLKYALSNLVEAQKTRQENRRDQNQRKRKQRANDDAKMKANPFAGQVLIVKNDQDELMIIRKTSLEPNHTIVVAPDKMNMGAAQNILDDENFVNTPTSIDLFGKIEGAETVKEKRNKKAEDEESQKQQAMTAMQEPPPPPPVVSDKNSMKPDSDHNATDMEFSVAAMFNQLRGMDLRTQIKNKLITPAQAQELERSQTLAAAGQRIVGQIMQNLPDGNWIAIHTGGKKDQPISKEWANFGGTDNTPKTDLIFQNQDTGEMVRMSVKVGEAQLMSGKAGETSGTFYSALMLLEGSEKLRDSTRRKARKIIKKMKEELAISERTKRGPVSLYQQGGDWQTKDRKVRRIENLHEEVTKEIEDLFEEDEDFAAAVVWEALTGTMKFGQNSPSTATHVLSMNKDGTNAVLTPVSQKYAKKIAKAMKIGVKFKSSAVETNDLRGRITQLRKKLGRNKLSPTEDFRPYNYWSAFRIFLPDMSKIAEYFSNSPLSILFEKKEKIVEIPDPETEMAAQQYLDEALNYIGDDPYKIMDFLNIEIDKLSIPEVYFPDFAEQDTALYNTIVINGKEKDIPVQQDFDYDNMQLPGAGLDQDDPSNYSKKDLQESDFYINLAKNFLREKRNYRKEYDNYQGTTKQKKNRAKRNKVNRMMKRLGRIRKGDGKDVDHKDGNPNNNSMSNLRVVHKSHNRSKK